MLLVSLLTNHQFSKNVYPCVREKVKFKNDLKMFEFNIGYLLRAYELRIELQYK